VAAAAVTLLSSAVDAEPPTAVAAYNAYLRVAASMEAALPLPPVSTPPAPPPAPKRGRWQESQAESQDMEIE